jgi:hypothetical protein
MVYFFKSIYHFSCLVYHPTITANGGLALGAVVDFGAQNCQYTTKVDAR